MNNSINNDLRDLVIGVNSNVPLISGDYITGINFDNAATTPPLKSVMQEINSFAPIYSSIHRGMGYKSRLSTDYYEKSRSVILNFINGDINSDTVIYVKNTTEAINKLSNRFNCGESKTVILTTQMEHHSNDLPWRKKFIVDYVKIDEKGRLRLDDLERKLSKYRGRVKLLTITGASNVTGYKNNIYKAAEIAHKYGSFIHVDGAQLIPHSHFDMKPKDSTQHIDFLSFSSHKMYAPFGIGVLIGPTEHFKSGCPDYKGGGTVKYVTEETVIWDEPPQKDEAGSPNLMGVVALVAAIKTLNSIGMNRIEERERDLIKYAIEGLKSIKDIELYGDCDDYSDRVGIIPFNFKDVYHEILAAILSYEGGIAVRSGCFCAHPYIQKLLKLSKKEIVNYINNPKVVRPGMVRISFGLYNTREEIDSLLSMLNKISSNKEYYIEKYNQILKCFI